MVGWGGWVILKNTLYILEVHIGKKRILHKSSVQKKFHAPTVGWKNNLPEMLPGLTAWTLFPNSYHKKDFVLALLSGRSRLLIGSWYWVRGIHSIRIFPSQMAFLYIYNTCGNQSWSVTEKFWGWVGYIPTNNSIDFFAYCISLLIFMLKANTISFVTCTFLCRKPADWW